VKLLEVFYSTNDDGKVIQNLVFEFVPKGLENFMEDFKLKKKHIPLKKIKEISKQILIGLKYCHNKNIVHRDLKPDNILMTEDEQIKICDFGSSKNIERKKDKRKDCKSTPYVVTRYYRAPELFFGKINYDSKIDIFSCGCIIAELFTLSPLFPGLNEGLQIFEYINILGMPDENYLREFNLNKNILETIKALENIEPYTLQEILNPNNYYDKKDIDEVCDLLYNMLSWNYKKRYTAEQCLEHPFLRDVIINKNETESINKNCKLKVINK
jgi:serine/threonine protein kinase